MQLVINVNDTVAIRVINEVCEHFGYEGTNKGQFVKTVIIDYIKSIVRIEEQKLARKVADDNVEHYLESEVIIN